MVVKMALGSVDFGATGFARRDHRILEADERVENEQDAGLERAEVRQWAGRGRRERDERWLRAPASARVRAFRTVSPPSSRIARFTPGDIGDCEERGDRDEQAGARPVPRLPLATIGRRRRSAHWRWRRTRRRARNVIDPAQLEPGEASEDRAHTSLARRFRGMRRRSVRTARRSALRPARPSGNSQGEKLPKSASEDRRQRENRRLRPRR